MHFSALPGVTPQARIGVRLRIEQRMVALGRPWARCGAEQKRNRGLRFSRGALRGAQLHDQTPVRARGSFLVPRKAHFTAPPNRQVAARPGAWVYVAILRGSTALAGEQARLG